MTKIQTLPCYSSQRLLRDLLKTDGYSLSRIAVEASLSIRILKGLLTGNTYELQPSNFSKLLQLHCKVCSLSELGHDSEPKQYRIEV